MKRGRLIVGVAAAAFIAVQLGAQEQPPAATFRSSIDLVRVTAVVRDHKGRFVQDLTVHDFQVFDNGLTRPITEFQRDIAGVSVALLFDVSGSMEGHLEYAREAATHVLSWLNPVKDEAAIYTFDTRLEEVMPFTAGLKALPQAMKSVVPFGATSLHDAIADTAKRVGSREGRRRAVVVLTDGVDTSSRLTPEKVSALASSIDVPVYVITVASDVDRDAIEREHSLTAKAEGALRTLSHLTGGEAFVTSAPAHESIAARQVVDELRHQYVLAVAATAGSGWHSLSVRTRDKDLSVRARSGYSANGRIGS